MHKTASDILDAVQETITGLNKAGRIDGVTLGESDRLSVRQALCLFLEAYQYPHLGNEDALESRRLEQEARKRAAGAIPEDNDPPEFSEWLATLIDARAGVDDLETVYFAMLDDGPRFGLPIRRP